MEHKPVPPPLITRRMNTSEKETPLWVFVLGALLCALVIGGMYMAGVR